MSNENRVEISEENVRLRSYFIWEREGCPNGNALEHWVRAKAEHESHTFIMPRVPISKTPQRSISVQIKPEPQASNSSAAKR